MQNKTSRGMILVILLCCAAVAVVDGIIMPGYAAKSAAKLLLFGLVPLLYARHRKISLGGLLRMEKQSLRKTLLMALALFILILGGYFLLKDLLDLSAVTAALTENAGVSREIFPVVAFSAIVFALYHVSILQGWFSPLLYALAMAGLAAGGLLFNFLDSRVQSILPSYLVHMAANLAINTIGLILFGLIG